MNVATLEEAEAIRARWRVELRHAPDAPPEPTRVKTYARSWLASRVPHLKPSTALRYAEILQLHVLPRFGEYFFEKLAPSDVAAWVAVQLSKYAGNTVKHHLALLRTICRDAIVDLRLGFDPCARVKAPRGRLYTDEDPNRLTPEELARLLKAFKRQPNWWPLVAVLVWTGTRWGEATALRWEDIDEEKGVIHVRRSQWRGKIGSTKTGRTRRVPLGDEVRAALRVQKRRAGGSPWIFPSSVGKLLQPGVLRKPLLRALADAKIETPLNVQGLRRTFNDIARQVAPGIVLRSMTGHTTEAMSDHYSHVAPVEQLRAARGMRKLVKGRTR